MKKISSFFSKFSTLKPSNRIVSEKVSEVLFEVGIPIKKEEIIFKGGTVYIKADQIIKGEIFMQKEKILSKLQSKLPKTISDIR